MLTEEVLHLHIWLSLGIIGLVLATAIGASLVVTGRQKELEHAPSADS
jgi:hypothetical protein